MIFDPKTIWSLYFLGGHLIHPAPQWFSILRPFDHYIPRGTSYSSSPTMIFDPQTIWSLQFLPSFPWLLTMVSDPQTRWSLLFLPSSPWPLTRLLILRPVDHYYFCHPFLTTYNGFRSSDYLITTIPAILSLPLTMVFDPRTIWSLLFLPSFPCPLTMVFDPQSRWSLLFLPSFPWLLTMVFNPQTNWSLLFLPSFPWPLTMISIFIPIQTNDNGFRSSDHLITTIPAILSSDQLINTIPAISPGIYSNESIPLDCESIRVCVRSDSRRGQ
jgi:hypothetical protein